MSDNLVLAKVQREITQSGSPRLNQEKAIARRPWVDRHPSIEALALLSQNSEPLPLGLVSLSRFSAVICNASRIHYGLNYFSRDEVRTFVATCSDGNTITPVEPQFA